MNHPKVDIRHALILDFEYKLQNEKSYSDAPNTLLSMNLDLNNAYRLATNRFKIPRNNITIITDVVGSENPWGVFRQDGENPKVVRLDFPDISEIVREMAQFIENTVRGIEDISRIKGEEDNYHEIMVYVSCHGARIGTEVNSMGEIVDYDNALIFQTLKDDKICRRYLTNTNIFNLLFGNIPIQENGTMNIQTIERHYVKHGSIYTLKYADAEECTFQLTPSQSFNSKSTRKTYKSGRGIPSNTHMICIMDTCHSGTMTDFHFIYDSTSHTFKRTSKMPSQQPFPICVCISASEDTSEAISSGNGSPFTRAVCDIFNRTRYAMTIKQFYKTLYQTISNEVALKKPTITATIDDPNHIMPFLTDLEECDESVSPLKTPRTSPVRRIAPGIPIRSQSDLVTLLKLG